MFKKRNNQPVVVAAIIIFAVVCHSIRVALHINASTEKLHKHDVSILIMSGGHKEVLKVQDGTWDSLSTKMEHMVMSEEAAFKEALLKDVHSFLEAVQEKKINESNIRSFVLNETNRQLSIQAGPELWAKDVQEIKSFLAELIQPKMDSYISVGSYFTYYQPQVEYLNKIDQEDPILSEYIRNHLWIPPVPKDVPYALGNPKQIDFTEGQWTAILDVFKNNVRKLPMIPYFIIVSFNLKSAPGYFIECGALDGETSSNTLDLELRRNWTGVLIEPSPINFGALLKKNRKVAVIPTCLSLEKHPTFVTFAQNVGIGRILNITESPLFSHVPVAQVHCMPFYSIYQTIGRKEIDFFVLDIEGHEVEVLHTIPFEKINILTFMIEHLNGKTYDKNYMREFMLKKNYRLYNGTKTYKWPDLNFFFIKSGSKYDVAHP